MGEIQEIGHLASSSLESRQPCWKELGKAQCLGSRIPSSAARMLETQVLGAEIKSPVVSSMQEGSGIPGVLGLLQRRSQRAPCSWNRALCERSQAGFWLGKKMIRFVRIATEHWRKSHEK